jgi:hypothetical protein
MGRRRKYFTEEQKREANLKKVKKFYWENKDALDQKAKDYYYKKKAEKEAQKVEDSKEKQSDKEEESESTSD